jgi:copper chaperone CopZ
MNQKFTLTGMNCKSCEAKVSDFLKTVPHVVNVKVSLENSEVSFSSSEAIDAATLNQVLPQKYRIQNQPETHKTPKAPSKLGQLKPLFLIFLYLICATFGLNYQTGVTASAMLDFMGLFYIVFAFFKLLDLKGFPASFSMYDPLAKRVPIYGWVYPFLETLLGIMLLTRWHTAIALWATLIVLGITTVGVAKTLLNKQKIKCACLGTALKLPMTEATLIENTLMIVMALFMLFV